MFTFNFTFHVPNPFSMSTLTSVANAATDAFNSVATDVREDPELLNYMVAGLGPGGVASGFGYDPNRLVKPPHPPSPSKSPTSPKSKGPKGSQGRHHTVGLGLANHHTQNRKRHFVPAGHGRNRTDFHGSTSGFVYVDLPPGSGTPKFPTQTYHSQPGSYLNPGTHGSAQGVSVNDLLNRDPLSESRKRGWMPASSEPSYASTNEDFTTGFFDTPKYFDDNEMGCVASMPCLGLDDRELSGMGSSVGDRRKRDDGNGDNYAMDADLPPAKRRKGLAGSVLSAALSAALVGTAVGLTVYRLWKDRGRADGIPPPPYEESQRSHQQTHDSQTLPGRVHPESTLPNARTPRRRHAATVGRRAAGNTVRHRKPLPLRFHPTAYNQQPGPSQPVQVQDAPSGYSDPKLVRVKEEGLGEPEDEMDWIGDRISQLIEEGKKALGAEVVVMSDSKEDEVDDGSGLWEDSDQGALGSSTSSRYGRLSPRRKRTWPSLLHQTIPGGLEGDSSPSKLPGYTSPTKPTFPGSPGLIQPSMEPVPALTSSTTSTTGWMTETEGDWQSEEVKESMARARAMYMAKKRGQVVGQAH